MRQLTFLFLGRENTLKEKALSDLKRQTLSGGSADLNYAVFYPDQLEPREFQDAVNTQPFLAERRFVVVKDIEHLSQAAKDSIASYVKNPSRNTILLLMSELGPREFDLRRKEAFFSAVLEYSEVRNFEYVKGERLNKYLIETAASHKKVISADAMNLLVEKLGNDLGNLNSALEGLVSYTGERRRIERSDVEALVGRSVEESVFNLTGAICRRQTAQAVSILSELLREATAPENIIGAIGAEFRRIMKVKYLVAKGRSQWQIQGELRIGPQAASQAVAVAGRMKLTDIKKALNYLLSADRDLKNREIDKRIVLETLVVQLSDFGKLR